MGQWLRGKAERIYARHVQRQITDGPDHVAVIQDGNRRYAREQGSAPTAGHHEGAKTTECVLEWCEDVGVKELTLYAFSTENFGRPAAEQRELFDLIESKLREFADSDRIHESEVRIRILGNRQLLPEQVQEAITYAETRTRGYDRFVLNVALAYGGREQLLGAARNIAHDVASGALEVEEIDITTVEDRLYDESVRDVDLIIRTGGDQRTSNFLPWHANGNEAAVFFCTPYWPEFRKIDFLRGIRTYEYRERSWRRTRLKRALALVRTLSDVDLPEARSVVRQCQDLLSRSDRSVVDFDSDDHEGTTPSVE